MTIIDRYVLWLFLKVLFVFFVSMTGLYIVIDSFSNLDEFLSLGKTQGGVHRVLFDYYGPRVLSFFDVTSGLLTLVAAMFAAAWLQRTHEMTALQAAGVAKGRVVKPLAAAALVVSLLAAANRETLIPLVRDRLTRNAQNWSQERSQALAPMYDHRTNILLNGRQAVAAERAILAPQFRLPMELASFGPQLTAAKATYRPPGDGRPGGYLLTEVTQPANLDKLATAYLDGRATLLAPRDTTWLREGECFVASEVDFDYLAAGSAWRQYASTPELVAGLRNPSLDFGADARVLLHARLVQPALDLTLLFLGLPLVIARENRNIFVAVGSCFALMAVFLVAVMTCHALGSHLVLPPVLAAWMPLLIFTPLAHVFRQSLFTH